jgi:hypothetical protein
VRRSLLAWVRALFISPDDQPVPDDPQRSVYERFAIPYTFKPQLSLLEAILAAGGAFARIILGSLLFAVWGTYTFLAWSALRNIFARVATLLAMIALFLLLFASLMLGISALVRMLWPKQRSRKKP